MLENWATSEVYRGCRHSRLDFGARLRQKAGCARCGRRIRHDGRKEDDEQTPVDAPVALPVCVAARGRRAAVYEAAPAADISVMASSVFSPPQDARHLVDGSGLSGDRHDNEGSARTMWHSVENPAASSPAPGLPAAPAWVRFAFAHPVALAELRLWNHNQAGLTDRGIRKATLFTSADGATWAAQALELPRASGAPGAQVSLVVKAPGKPVKAAILAAESNYGSTIYGLSEVQFMTQRDVAEADLPFPAELTCEPQPF